MPRSAASGTPAAVQPSQASSGSMLARVASAPIPQTERRIDTGSIGSRGSGTTPTLPPVGSPPRMRSPQSSSPSSPSGAPFRKPSQYTGATPSAFAAAMSCEPGDPLLPPQKTACEGGAKPSKAQQPRINISALGHGGYREMFLKSIEGVDGCEVAEQAEDDASDIYVICPMDREVLSMRMARMRPQRAANMLPGMTDICEKVTFCRGIRQSATLCPELCQYMPPTWILPAEISVVYSMLGEAKGSTTFILKPEYGLQGSGIFLVRTRADLDVALAARALPGRGYVCQRYLANPLTLGGFKFDLRIYLCITSVAPVEGALCHEGLARFCATPYAAPTASNISNKTAHLTNYSLNCKHEEFARTQAGANPDEASKRLLSKTLQQIAAASDGRFCEERFWSQVEDISKLVLITLVPGLVYNCMPHFPVAETEPSRCYHVLGLDVILDADYRPWLLEVNSTPAMDVETAVPAPEEMSPPSPPAPAENATVKKSDGSNKKRASKRRGRSVAKKLSELLGKTPPSENEEAPTSPSATEPPEDRGPEGVVLSPASQQDGETPQAEGDAVVVTESPPVPLAVEGAEDEKPAAIVDETDEGSESSKKVKARKSRRKKSQRRTIIEAPQPASPQHGADHSKSYAPSEMRKRVPFPEVCRCTAHAMPHRHAICDVDMVAKTTAIGGAMRIMLRKNRPSLGLGDSEDMAADNYVPIRLDGDLLRVEGVLRGLSAICVRLQRWSRNGLCIASLRKAFQASEDICGSRGADGTRLSQHELDSLLNCAATRRGGFGGGGGSSGEMQGAPAAYTQLPVLTAFAILQECAHRCCDKGVAAHLVGNDSALQRLEWLLEALTPVTPTGTGSVLKASGAQGYIVGSPKLAGLTPSVACQSSTRRSAALPAPIQRASRRAAASTQALQHGRGVAHRLGYAGVAVAASSLCPPT
eukprot:TRINITY_DN80340_c0_g1_i1.p1 TRINITY_DN80340_c0_g1~~TRINITY_DN80340_c0_g1_i1.p1  ORF type:complete len:933 (-),score=175.47 TRINITY_DN80340_c0_g1_i1:173-2971(-)